MARLALCSGLAVCLATGGAAASETKTAPVHKITQSESFVMLAPMYATILDARRPSGLLMVAIGLDIPSEDLRDEAEHALPILRDDYVRNLMSFAATSIRPWRQPDVVEIANRLQGVTDRALRRKGARVLLAQVAIRVTH
jgi:flagellar basal body-associated protein FliL